jgi:Protein of unknown function (DUF2442)
VDICFATLQMTDPVFKVAPRAMAVACSDDELRVSLTDGRCLSVPIVWFPRLARASVAERANCELMGDGQGIHWPDVDEDVSVAGLIAGQPSFEFQAAYA